MTHPAALVARLPKTIAATNGSGGLPWEAKIRAQSAGIIKINRPAGLSQRKSCKIVNQVGSREDGD
jgi:hypothetical protein